MKKLIVIIVILTAFTLQSFAESVYFDVGIGLGKAETKVNGNNVSEIISSEADDLGLNIGLKLGFGPLPGSPIYLAGTIDAIGHRFYKEDNYLQFNSYLFGPSVILYPALFFQIAGSFGYSWIANTSNIDLSFYDSEYGYAYDISAAIDIELGDQNFVLGLEYICAKNILEITEAKEISYMLNMFLRYVYKQDP